MPAPVTSKALRTKPFTFTGDLCMSYLGHATENCPRLPAGPASAIAPDVHQPQRPDGTPAVVTMTAPSDRLAPLSYAAQEVQIRAQKTAMGRRQGLDQNESLLRRPNRVVPWNAD